MIWTTTMQNGDCRVSHVHVSLQDLQLIPRHAHDWVGFFHYL